MRLLRSEGREGRMSENIIERMFGSGKMNESLRE